MSWHHDSITAPSLFIPISRKQATKIWHRARRLDMRTARKGRHGGVIGRSALAVLSVLIFDYLDYATGRLDPSHATIARKARMCERSVRTALAKLKSLGILTWLRRATREVGPWGVKHRQESNAYSLVDGPILAEPEPPLPEHWGQPVPVPEILEQAAEAIKQGDRKTMLAVLDAGDELARIFADWYRLFDEQEGKRREKGENEGK